MRQQVLFERSPQSYARQRDAGFTCRVRKYAREETARRCLWAIGQQRRIDTSKMDVKYCKVCTAWHIVRSS